MVVFEAIVLILVLMEYGLGPLIVWRNLVFSLVLILVLMEYGLGSEANYLDNHREYKS